MNARQPPGDVIKPDPKLPPETPCVECGEEKSTHRGLKLWCQPLVLLPEKEVETWRTFR